MKYRNYIFLFIVLVLLFSCDKKKENNIKQETEQTDIKKTIIETEEDRNNDLKKYYVLDDETREAIRSKITATNEEKEAMKEFLYKNDKYYKEYNKKIVYIEKANFGMHGGDNWIVRLNSETIYFYAINGNKIINKKYIPSFNLEGISNFNIMQDIPGTRIDNSSSSFGDFNSDGKEEIFEYGFYGYRFEIHIWGYDEVKDDFVSYCEIPFKILDSEDGPAPVEFMTYKGMFGFKVFYSNIEVAGGPSWVPEPDPKNYTWRFYTWDAEQKKYIEIGELVE